MALVFIRDAVMRYREEAQLWRKKSDDAQES